MTKAPPKRRTSRKASKRVSWPREYQIAAQRQGWDIFHTDYSEKGEEYQIQALEDPDMASGDRGEPEGYPITKFKGKGRDEKAGMAVRNACYSGCPVARRAAEFLISRNMKDAERYDLPAALKHAKNIHRYTRKTYLFGDMVLAESATKIGAREIADVLNNHRFELCVFVADRKVILRAENLPYTYGDAVVAKAKAVATSMNTLMIELGWK